MRFSVGECPADTLVVVVDISIYALRLRVATTVSAGCAFQCLGIFS